MIAAYDEHYLGAVTDEALRSASAARVGHAGLAARRAVRAAEAARRRSLRADRRASEARDRLTSMPTRAVAAR